MQDISFTFLKCTIISLFTLLSNSSTANRKINFVFLSRVYLFLSLYVLQGNTGKNAIFQDIKSADKSLHPSIRIYMCISMIQSVHAMAASTQRDMGHVER